MNEIKHTFIAKQLETNIRSGNYKHKLPSVRDLSSEFGVSTRTISKAVKSLTGKGLVIPAGYEGNLLKPEKHKRPKTGIIGIFCNIEKPDVAHDVLLKNLKILIEKDDYKPLFMNVPDVNIFNDENFWRKNWLDGYIFAYGSINKELAYTLRRNGIPFVSGNRLPEDYGANWVDFNIEDTLNKLFKALLKAGRRRIAFAFGFAHMRIYLEYIADIWTGIQKQAGRYNREYFWSAPGKIISEEATVAECANYFLGLEKAPDAVILAGLDPELFEHELNRSGIIVPRDITIAIRTASHVDTNRKYPYCEVSYQTLADNIWELFKASLNNPEMEPEYRSLPAECELKYLK